MNRPLESPLGSAEPTREALLALLAERDRELAEARLREAEATERQAATSEILRVVSQSPGDAQPVFDSIVLAAVRLLHCGTAGVLLCDGGAYFDAATATRAGLYTAKIGKTPIDPRANFPSRAIVAKERYYLPDWSRVDLPEFERGVRDRLGVACSLYLPLLRGGECFGTLALMGERADMFGASEIALAESFRDQAVIAIENARLFNDTREALERQTATAEILKVIASSPGDTQPVFYAIAESARRLVGGYRCAINRVEGDWLYLTAYAPIDPVSDAAVKATYPQRRPPDDSPIIQALQKQGFWAITDPEAELDGLILERTRLLGIGSFVTVPLTVDGEFFGSILVSRRERGSFAPQHVKMLQTFADQAAIAIQNARMFNETREALEREKATAEILRVIASSPGDERPVFQTIVGAARRLIGGHSAVVTRLNNGFAHVAAITSTNPATDAEVLAAPPYPIANSPVLAAYREGRPFVIPDVEANDPLGSREIARKRGWRSCVYVPLMLREEQLGSLMVSRATPGGFVEEDVQLLRAFADQAVIAIQNARLLNDTKEALEQQRASAAVLSAIGRSVSDAAPVFENILDACQRLFAVDRAAVYLIDGEVVRGVAGRGGAPGEEFGRDVTPLAGSRTAQAIAERRALHLPDVLSLPDLPDGLRERVTRVGNVSIVYAPMLWEDRGVGAIVVNRSPPKPFSDKEIALLQSFADQATIAIQNARLFHETQRALERQTATSEILKVIAASPSDTAPVFEAIAHSANRLLGGLSTAVWRFEGEIAHLAAYTPTNPEADAALRAMSPLPVPELSVFVLLSEGEIAQLPDTEQGPERLRDLARLRGFRAMLFVPLIQQGAAVGFVSVTRKAPGAFDDDDVGLLKTFADQAVIAIQNARLFNETKEALEQQKASGEVLAAIGQSVSDAAPVFEKILDACQRLFGGDEVGVYTIDDAEMVRVAAWRGAKAEEVRRDVTPLAQSYTGKVIRERRVHHIPDLEALPEISERLRERVKRLGGAALIYAPMLWKDRGLGSVVVSRAPPRPFSEKEQALLQGFADQAAIAVENARLFNETQARTRDLTEALQQQTATADVLKVISRSAFDLDAVLRTLIGSAISLCEATRGVIWMRKGDRLRLAAYVNYPEEWVRAAGDLAIAPAPDAETASGVAAFAGEVVNVEDMLTDPRFEGFAAHRLGDYRGVLAVPMDRDGSVVGVITLSRPEARRFTDRQVALVKAFADQAVIAIENVRLFEEVQARTRDLTEALEQQTATADVLKAISRSAFDLDTVLETLISTAVRLCNATYGQIFRRHGDVYRYAASRMDVDPAYRRHEQSAEITPGRGTLVGRVALENRAVSVLDAWNDPEYEEKDAARVGNVRAMLGVPLMRGGEPIGAFALARSAPIPFTERQIELVTTFADQAVIAIENVRLFDEVQARTRDLSEALQQQTATADVLKVISRSAFDLQPVLDTLIGSAVALCGAVDGTIFLRDGEFFRFRATSSPSPELAAFFAAHPRKPGRESVVGRVVLSGGVECVRDVLEEEGYEVPAFALNRVRALLGVPLLRDGKVEGVLTLARGEPGLFTPRQIELVQTFADQAVIAIENVRLFDEVRARTRDLTEALQQQTATADVLKVISRSAFDLQAVFDTLVASAVELCAAFSGSICVREGEAYRYRGNAGSGATTAMSRYLTEHPATPGRGTIVGRVLLSGKVETIPDVLEDPDYVVPLTSHGVASRALLGVPLVGKAGLEGALVLTRLEPGRFADRQIEIVQTFADQAVIAIENVRLFEQVQARTRELAASLDDLRKAQDRLIQSEKLASLGQLTAGIAHEIKNPLNFVNNFSALTRELLDELRDVLAEAPLEAGQREEADELIGMAASNLDKVVSHGKRADSIVKNMLLHSREGSGERASVSVNAMVEEALNLAYHGARAEKPGFDVTIARSLDPAAGAAEIYPQEMTRVLLNLISNAFYATAQRRQAEASGAWTPHVAASTRDLGDAVEISIRDNGTGIPEDVKARMFNPFFTTKPAGEGTGLGLSLSHDIVVKQHGGALEVATEPGVFTEFTIRLPRRGVRGATAERGAPTSVQTQS